MLDYSSVNQRIDRDVDLIVGTIRKAGFFVIDGSEVFSFRWSDKNESILLAINFGGEILSLMVSWFENSDEIAARWFEYKKNYYRGKVLSGPSEVESFGNELGLWASGANFDDIQDLLKRLPDDLESIETSISDREEYPDDGGFDESMVYTLKDDMRVPGTNVILEKGDRIRVLEAKGEIEKVDIRLRRKKTIFDFPAYRVSNQTLKLFKHDLRATRNPNIGFNDIEYLEDSRGHRYAYVEYSPSIEIDGFYFELF